jgi:hypothetical protein
MTALNAEWGHFVANIAAYDEELRQERIAHFAAACQQGSETVIKEVYQPTSIVDGQRAGGGGRRVQEVSMSSGQVAAPAASANGEELLIPELQDGVADLSLTNGVNHHHIQNGNSANLSARANSCSHGAGSGQPGQLNGGTNGPSTPLVDIATMTETNDALGTLPGFEMSPHLLAQFGASAGTPVPANNASTTASASGLTELGEQKNGEDEEEDWLI